MIITLFESPKYNSCIFINSANRNLYQLKKINTLLLQNNLSWSWLIEYTGITQTIYRSYFSDQAKISLNSVELISIALHGVIKSPREIMNPELPSLHGGEYFKLNFSNICDNYNVSTGELMLKCKMDRGIISLLKRNKAQHLRAETITRIFDYFVSIGIPLTTPLDLIYFPYWDESPFHFLPETAVKNLFVKRNHLVKFPK